MAGGPRCHGDAAAALRAIAPAAQRAEKRGGPRVVADVPGLQLLGGPGTNRETADWVRSLECDEAPGSNYHSPNPGPQHDSGDLRAAEVSHRLEGLLPAG